MEIDSDDASEAQMRIKYALESVFWGENFTTIGQEVFVQQPLGKPLSTELLHVTVVSTATLARCCLTERDSHR